MWSCQTQISQAKENDYDILFCKLHFNLCVQLAFKLKMFLGCSLCAEGQRELTACNGRLRRKVLMNCSTYKVDLAWSNLKYIDIQG